MSTVVAKGHSVPATLPYGSRVTRRNDQQATKEKNIAFKPGYCFVTSSSRWSVKLACSFASGEVTVPKSLPLT
jgi:hypothetical protein